MSALKTLQTAHILHEKSTDKKKKCANIVQWVPLSIKKSKTAQQELPLKRRIFPVENIVGGNL